MLTLICGKSFTGKTARMLAELRNAPRVLLLDAKRQELVRLKGWQHVFTEFGGERWSDSVVVDALRPYAYGMGGSFRVVLHMRNGFREQLELVCRLLPYVRDLVLAVDEASFFFDARRDLGPETQAVVVSGSHDGIDCLLTTQRPNLVHITARANSLRRLLYRMDEKADLDWCAQFLPDDFLCELPRLQNYVCVDWRDGSKAFVDHSFAGTLADFLPSERVRPEKK